MSWSCSCFIYVKSTKFEGIKIDLLLHTIELWRMIFIRWVVCVSNIVTVNLSKPLISSKKGRKYMSYVSRERKKEKKQLRQKNRNNINKQSLQPFCRCYTNFVNGICSSSTFFWYQFLCCVSSKLISVRKKYKILHINMIPPLYKNNL